MPVVRGCSWSGYYSWRDRPESMSAIRRRELAVMVKDILMVKDIFEDSDDTYGYRRIQAILKRRDVRADGATIRSIMRELGLRAAQPRAKVQSTVPAEDLAERPDLLERDFTANEPGRKLCGDMSVSVRGRDSSILRPFWTAARRKWWVTRWPSHVRTSLVCEAIDMAVRRCPIEKGVTIFHSDRGSQYTSQKFLEHLEAYGIRPSVGRTGA